MTPSPRALAIDALVRVEQGAYSHIVLPAMLRESGLDVRSRAFATDLVYGTLRRRRRLDHLLLPLLDRPLDELDPAVRAALRLGADQLVDGVAPHAAVSETVTAAPVRARGFVNAVLRRLARSGPPWALPGGDDVAALTVRLSYPDWIVQELLTELGADDALASLEAMNEPPSVAVRANRRRTDRGRLARELRSAGMKVESGRVGADALVVRGTGDLARVPAIAEGRATPQDEASQAVVDVLGPAPGDSALDLAGAPGGKATAIAERVGDAGRVIAIDVHPGRLRLVLEASTRLGLGNLSAVVADARALPTRRGCFERVLVDAPCSGLGVLRRRPEARWRARPAAVEELAALQRALLGEAAGALALGGTLVYSVCTLTRAETVAVDEWAESTFDDLVAMPAPGPPWRPRGRGALLLPHDAGTDGMFVLRLVRRHAEGGK